MVLEDKLSDLVQLALILLELMVCQSLTALLSDTMNNDLHRSIWLGYWVQKQKSH